MRIICAMFGCRFKTYGKRPVPIGFCVRCGKNWIGVLREALKK